MVDANGLIIAPEDRMQIKAGEKVRVQILDRSFESAILENHQGVEAT
jgi:DNA-directed RNA polymerase subunit E'/Rpb7